MANTQTATVTVRIPTPLRSYTDGQATVESNGETVKDVLTHLVDRYGDLKSNLYTDDGTLRQFVNIYVNDDDIRYKDGPDTPVSAGDEVSIVPSIAGG
ncbi:ubiquitin-like small modifier protein 1 [Longibacter salinarum]|uniref:ubiquitin-like small modifier protein 1 n=1 Tax=Longibacter salinarum TaxID=1850348 RepID=UPI001C54F285|nr:ubiquitin-like small modifier protein 1 [Longibacter salinarum]